MKFYRVHFRTDGGTSNGYEFFTAKRKAEKAKADADADADDLDTSDEIETLDVKPTRAGILAALNKYGSHAENG